MTFIDEVVHREARWSLGRTDDGRCYLSIPVSNGAVDYEEYYQVDQATFARFRDDPAAALAFAERCRARLEDHRLLQRPGAQRGTPC